MLRLLLLRHAKAAPHVAQDHSRALNGKGRTDSAKMGQYLHAEQLIPDLTVASDSLRTQETAKLVLASAGFSARLQLEPRLYLAEARTLQNLLGQVAPKIRTLLAVGHNPGFHELALSLVGYGDRYAAARLREKFPTCALAVLDFDVEDWGQVAPRSGRLDRFITLANLESSDED